MLKVIEVATLLGVSKVTIYKKLEGMRKELKPYVHKKRNITFIDDQGIEMIRKALPQSLDVQFAHMYQGKEQDGSDELGLDDVRRLKVEIEVKNRQISELLDRIKKLEKDHLDDLQVIVSLLETQTAIKRREIDNKITILNGYKDIIGYNKERIRNIEESAYNLFK